MIGAGVHLYLYVCVYMTTKSLNDTFVVDLPFQTLVVYFPLNL